MKTASALLLLVIVASALPQSADNPLPPDTEIVKISWAQEVPLPKGWDRSDYSASDPGGVPPRSERRTNRLPRKQLVYAYSMKIKNDGAKMITAVAWEYRVFDPGSNKELGRHAFSSHQKLEPHKITTVTERLPSPPSGVVSVQGLEKDTRSPYVERVIINAVLYADGTGWTNPTADSRAVEELKHGPRKGDL